MLLSLRNINFQSHRDILFKFVPGINLIIGSSGKGKTIVRRALTWVKDNRPTGNAYVSWWDRDNKKNPKTEHSVSIRVDDKLINRFKTKDFNGYSIGNLEDGKKLMFEAIKTDVPPEITNILNLSEVNIQRQWDQPFLLSESPGKVAEFFNNIIKLNVIDDVLSEVESMRRKNNRDIEDSKKTQEETEKEIIALSWVKEATKQIEKIENWNIIIEEKNNRFNKLNSLIDQFHQYEDELAGIPENLNQAIELMDKIDNIRKNIDIRENRIDIISDLLEKYDNNVKELEEIQKYDFSVAEKLMADILTIENKIIKKEQELVKAESILDKYEERASKRAEVNTLIGEIKSLENQLGDTCPLCGQPIDKEMLI